VIHSPALLCESLRWPTDRVPDKADNTTNIPINLHIYVFVTLSGRPYTLLSRCASSSMLEIGYIGLRPVGVEIQSVWTAAASEGSSQSVCLTSHTYEGALSFSKLSLKLISTSFSESYILSTKYSPPES